MHGLHVGLLESQELVREHQTSLNVTETGSSQISIAVNENKRIKPFILTSGRSTQQIHKGLVMREDIEEKLPEVAISRDASKENNSQVEIHVAMSPNKIKSAKDTAGLLTSTTLYAKRLGQDDKSSMKYVRYTSEGFTPLIENPIASLSFQSFRDSGRELLSPTGPDSGPTTCQQLYKTVIPWLTSMISTTMVRQYGKTSLVLVTTSSITFYHEI